MSPLGIAGAAVAAAIAAVTLVTLFLNPDYNRSVSGAAVWFVAGHRVFRLLRAPAAGAVAGRRVRPMSASEKKSAMRTCKTLLARRRPARSGDELAGIAAAIGRGARRGRRWSSPMFRCSAFLHEPLIPYETDEVTRLICDSHDAAAFAPIAHLTVGEFREWLLSEQTGDAEFAAVSRRG